MTRRVHLSVRCECTGEPRCETSAETPASLPRSLICRVCASEKPVSKEGLTPQGGLSGCLACGHPELYTKKRFPAATGLSVVVAAAVLAPSTHYLSLAAAALVDLLLYHGLPDAVVCYVCAAQHRGFLAEPRHPRFDREIAERLRFGARAVMGKPMREGGTAGAPDPEH